MPRHTHKPARAKHTRAHVRAQRERHITRRFARAKRDGTLDHLWLAPKVSYVGSMPVERYRAEQDIIIGELVALGADRDPAYNVAVAHPELLRRMPAGLAGKVSGRHVRGGLGALADRDAFVRYCSGCSACRPYRYEPGYRTTVENAMADDIRQGLADHLDGERDLTGRLTSANVVARPSKGWC